MNKNIELAIKQAKQKAVNGHLLIAIDHEMVINGETLNEYETAFYYFYEEEGDKEKGLLLKKRSRHGFYKIINGIRYDDCGVPTKIATLLGIYGTIEEATKPRKDTLKDDIGVAESDILAIEVIRGAKRGQSKDIEDIEKQIKELQEKQEEIYKRDVEALKNPYAHLTKKDEEIRNETKQTDTQLSKEITITHGMCWEVKNWIKRIFGIA